MIGINANATNDARTLIAKHELADKCGIRLPELVCELCLAVQHFGVMPWLHVESEFDNFGREALLDE